MFVGSKTSSRTGAGSVSLAEIPRSTRDKQQRSKGVPDLDRLAGDHAGLELVELPGGRIVAVDSEEARAHRVMQTGREPTAAVAQQAGGRENDESHDRDGSDDDAVLIDDEVHKLWADMGLSRRAWSKSPSPQQRTIRHRIQPSPADLDH